MVGGGSVGPPPLTRYTTVRCAGTLAEMVPVLVEVPLVHASRSVNELPDFPTAAAVVEIVVVVALVEEGDRDVTVGERLGQHVVAAGGGYLGALLA